jgi:hypothetical protein
MKTALDTSVILDVLTADPAHAAASEAAINAALSAGPLLVGECVIAEITPALEVGAIGEFMRDWGLQFVPASLESALLAGEMFRSYLQRSGSQDRVVPDFLVGAHAQVHAGRLLARDRGYYRDYFTNLQLLVP